MIVHVCPPRVMKQKVRVFKYNVVNRNKKLVKLLFELKESNKTYEVYKRDRKNGKFDIAVHIH